MERLDGLGAVLAGPANVVMQLSWPPVAYGVLESSVASGRLGDHPLKRFRTTFTYLAVATLGGDDERRHMRSEVGRAHQSVRSGPGHPVGYDAFDPDLQLWVAACLYRGAEDVARRFFGPMAGAEADAFYRDAAALGTTLQVRPETWPADRAAFEEYWAGGLKRISIDPKVHRYLWDVITSGFLPAPAGAVHGPWNLWLTTGFLAPEFRLAMGLAWSAADQARFDSAIAAMALARRLLPGPARRFPLNWFLWDFRVRSLLARPVV
ncbi:MAG: DUF2236 domain-containing protein [Acidobacteriota bacterium]|nr:DUF2236 domain-containing protein [Acidobacteriota bacterium]